MSLGANLLSILYRVIFLLLLKRKNIAIHLGQRYISLITIKHSDDPGCYNQIRYCKYKDLFLNTLLSNGKKIT